MTSEIHSGDLIGVGGAVCVVPEKCDHCGQPATVFESHRAADPRHNRVSGWCAVCASKVRAEADWRAGLSPDAMIALIDLEDGLQYAASGMDDPRLSRQDRAACRADLDRYSEEIDRFRTNHGAPAQ